MNRLNYQATLNPTMDNLHTFISLRLGAKELAKTIGKTIGSSDIKINVKYISNNVINADEQGIQERYCKLLRRNFNAHKDDEQGEASAEYICGNDLISLDFGFEINPCLASGDKGLYIIG
jgi:hypothetical protein